MNVKKLIDLLRQFDDDLIVVVGDDRPICAVFQEFERVYVDFHLTESKEPLSRESLT